jgi:hypothetical protein
MPQYKCLDNFGIEDQFTEGQTYEGRICPKDSVMLSLTDDQGTKRSSFTERFTEIIKVKIDWDDYDEEANRRCTCSTSPMPPCSYCENGGWCQEHEQFRNDCGCEWDEENEDY